MATLIELIKTLRETTGAGMMDCKKALVENDNDVEKAKDWLREKGITTAAKKSSRIAAEGLTYAVKNEKGAVILEINSETDFVSRSEQFVNLVHEIGNLLLTKAPKTKEEADALVEPLISQATVSIGEKLSFRRYDIIVDATDKVATYIHMGGKISTLVLLEKADEELAKGLAMHVAANAPLYISEKDIDAKDIEHEKHIQLEAAKNDEKLANKSEAMLLKIIEGKVSKTFAETTLLSQIYLLDGETKIDTLLKQKGNAVLKFVRFQVGEGIEKRKEDFAEEVLNTK